MKRFLSILCGTLLFLLPSCGGGGSGTIDEPINKPQPNVPTNIPLESISFAQSTYEVNVGSTITLNAVLSPSNTTYTSVTWESSDPHLGKIEVRTTGQVVALAPGTVTITASCAGKSATCQLVIKDIAEDLSFYDIHFAKQASMNTANCYVVSKPGVYKIPLVYGNAIKNGATNRGAYVAPFSGNSGFLEKFKDHSDKEIYTGDDDKDPWVSCKYPINKSLIIWQDSQDLITNLSYGGAENALEKKYLYFTVKENNFNQGNAVLAVYSGSEIVWSWHIWVTNVNLTPVTIKNYEGKSYSVMPVYLGWCEPKSSASKNGGTYGNIPYYQFGRKDPLLPSDGELRLRADQDVNKKYYTSSGSPGFKNLQYNYGKGDYFFQALCIQNPGALITNYKGNYCNLWNMEQTYDDRNYISVISSDKVSKTVYDPTPAGYTVAPYNFLTSVSPTGQNILVLNYEISEWNIMGGLDKGVHLYTLGYKTGPTYYLRAMGNRDQYGVNGFGGNIYVWCAHSTYTNGGVCVTIDSYACHPMGGNTQDSAFGIIPVKEN